MNDLLSLYGENLGPLMVLLACRATLLTVEVDGTMGNDELV